MARNPSQRTAISSRHCIFGVSPKPKAFFSDYHWGFQSSFIINTKCQELFKFFWGFNKVTCMSLSCSRNSPDVFDLRHCGYHHERHPRCLKLAITSCLLLVPGSVWARSHRQTVWCLWTAHQLNFSSPPKLHPPLHSQGNWPSPNRLHSIIPYNRWFAANCNQKYAS